MRAGTRHARSNRWRLGQVTVLVCGALSLSAMTEAAAQTGERGVSCAGLETGPMRTVARVIDGETVALDDGTELRLIGALTPRALDAGAEPGT